MTKPKSSSHQSHASSSSVLPYWLGGLAIVGMVALGAYSYRALLKD